MGVEPHELSASEARARIGDGSLTSEALVRSCLERIEAYEPDIAAWICLEPARAIAEARARDASSHRGPLHGVPVGVKDVVDTRDLPTAYGSPIYRDARPVADAVCVANTRAAGGLVLGKTVSTEFAFRYPGRTRNPHDHAHSPGGSSSGSAAAVAAKMVPLALGTQTAGSVIRPASYCGVFGYKPSFGLLSFAGIRHLSESFDTLGCMARSLDDIALYRDVLLALAPRPIPALSKPPRIALCRTHLWEEAQPAARTRLEEAGEVLSRAGARVTELDLPQDFADSLERYWRIARFETRNCLANELTGQPENVSRVARELIEAGGEISYQTYVADLAWAVGLRARMHTLVEDVDAVLTPSSAGEAPRGLYDTGPIHFNYLWTMLYMPAVTVPAFTGPAGLPIGVQLVGRRLDDEHLLAVAQWVSRTLA